MIEPNVILGIAIIAGALLVAILLLYGIVVCPSLYRHGARFPTGLIPWRFVRDLRDYKEIIVSTGDFPFYYYLIWILTWALVVTLLVFAWFVWQHHNETTVPRRYTY